MSGSRRGFTLIEVLVAISIVGILMALILPAVQVARESARRTQCKNNLRQIGIALHSYQEIHGCLPLGRMGTPDPRWFDPGFLCASGVQDKGFLVSILPYAEQAPLYNSINQSLTIFGAENSTIFTASVGIYTCPSDFESGRPRTGYPQDRLPIASGSATLMSLTSASYAGCHGSSVIGALPHPRWACQVPAGRAANVNGCITDVGPVTFASITDGLSHTMVATERATATFRELDVVDPLLAMQAGWWFSGDWGDTVMTAYFPPNVRKRVTLRAIEARMWSASSLHPGGVNVLMGDGSVRFIKDSVQAWPHDPQWGNPLPTSAATPGIWQALGTRNGGEIVSGDVL